MSPLAARRILIFLLVSVDERIGSKTRKTDFLTTRPINGTNNNVNGDALRISLSIYLFSVSFLNSKSSYFAWYWT